MLKKCVALFWTATFLSVLVSTRVNFDTVSGWSNGGFSSDPSNPDYGTHDWIAEHALDWLPQAEKQYILDNLATYLYGTELPDNWQAPDGIGDTTKHHVYYFANGSLQEDDSAVRAQQEYGAAVNYFKFGNLANAAKKLGVMSHYICDVAVFGHVMSPKTEWGDETHHGDYESYVNTRTNNYVDEFNTFLGFDGVLSNITAYNVTLTLAYDTTFDVDGDLTCVWMDQHYDWNNATFRNRCGESLNLAVNLVADVLHTFYLDISKHQINVPFHYQDIYYYCGPACLEMVFDYYGEDINQTEIADVARTFPEVTFTDELRRAAHFSNISTSMGNEIPDYNITGYTLRKLGYAAFEAHNLKLEQLKSYIGQDKPLILLMWYSDRHVSGHYRVAVGYNETHIFLHDPWNKPLWDGKYGGPNIVFNNTEFLDLWSYYDNWTLYVSPWIINISAPTYIKPETPFKINFTITYPAPLPDALFNYPASLSNVTITLPENLSLAEGEAQKKTLSAGLFEAGSSAAVSWKLTAKSAGTYTIILESEGLITGSVGEHVEYPAYGYSDKIGATTNFTIKLEEDNEIPIIGVPSRVPQDDVPPLQEVKVSVNVTDMDSGVKNVTLLYTINNGTSWEPPRPMIYNDTRGCYETTIPGQEAGTWVKFKIIAYDYVGNNATRDGPEPYCTYYVVPEFPSGIFMSLFMAIIMLTALYVKKRYNPKTTSRSWLRCKSWEFASYKIQNKKILS